MRYTEVIWSEDSQFVWETSPVQFLFLFLLVSTNRMRSWELYHEAEKTGHSIAGGTAGGRAPTRSISDADAKERRGSRCEGGGQTGDINTSG